MQVSTNFMYYTNLRVYQWIRKDWQIDGVYTKKS